MSKKLIKFNNKEYEIDESEFTSAKAEIENHLLYVMNGSGAVIKLGDSSYNVDSAKLSAVANKFVSHLETLYGNGQKVIVNNVEYSIDSTKLSNTIAEIESVLGGSISGGEEVEIPTDLTGYTVIVPAGWSVSSEFGFFELETNYGLFAQFGYVVETDAFGPGFIGSENSICFGDGYEVPIKSVSFTSDSSFTIDVYESIDSNNVNLIQWFVDNNAIFTKTETSSVPTDLTGYTISVPEGWTTPQGYGQYNIISSKYYHIGIGYGITSFGGMPNIGAQVNRITLYDSNVSSYKEYEFGEAFSFSVDRGEDTSNSSLIQWLIDNRATFTKE